MEHLIMRRKMNSNKCFTVTDTNKQNCGSYICCQADDDPFSLLYKHPTSQVHAEDMLLILLL